MKNYVNGLATKERIFEACKELFCEKGYLGTTYTDICKLAQVHPGTITHHFTSKKNIASIIFDDIIRVFYQRSAELFPDADDLQQVMTASGMHQKLLFDDAVYRRFSSEYSSEVSHVKSLLQYTDSVPKAYEVTLDRVGKKKADFLFTAYKGMDCYIESYIDAHIDELTFEEVFEYIAVIYYQYEPSVSLKKRIAKALSALAGVRITFDCFNIKVLEIAGKRPTKNT